MIPDVPDRVILPPAINTSTPTKLLSENDKWPVYSIDSYFTNPETNNYKFEFDKNHLAYKNCEELTELAMKNRIEKIILDNSLSQ
jgi:hypothetical protein